MPTSPKHRHTFGPDDRCTRSGCGKRRAPQGRPSGRRAPPATSHASPRAAGVSPFVGTRAASNGTTDSAERSWFGGEPDDEDDDDGLSRALGRVDRGSGVVPDVAGAAEAKDAKPAPSWCGFAGSLVGDGALVLCKAAVRRTGTEPGSWVDPAKKAKLDDALGRQLAVWFPDAELPPWGEALMILAAIAGGMKATGTPLPPKRDVATAPQSDSSAETADGTNERLM